MNKDREKNLSTLSADKQFCTLETRLGEGQTQSTATGYKVNTAKQRPYYTPMTDALQKK